MPVPESLPDALAAPANCALATIVNALSPLPVPCRSVWVQGGGLLGLYACAWLRHQGVEKVFCTDLSQERLALVAEFGGIPVMAGPDMRTRVLDESGGGVDLVLEVAGSAAVIPDGIAVLRPGGTYVWAGMVHPQTQLDLTGEAVLRKCLTLRGVHNYAPEHLAVGLNFLDRMKQRLPFEKLVSPALPLSALDEALVLTESRRWMRVAVAP